MRQAGRYLPEYRSVRSRVNFLELCKRPDLAAEVTLTAQAALGVDAAILFADLLPILEPMGFQLEYTPGDGPAIHNPVRRREDLDRVRDFSTRPSWALSTRRSRSCGGICPAIFRCSVLPGHRLRSPLMSSKGEALAISRGPNAFSMAAPNSGPA